MYLKSKECELADTLILAFQSSDREKLEQAKRSVEMNYLDVEMQRMGRSLVLFDECYLDSDPYVTTVVSSTINGDIGGSGGVGGSADAPTKKLLFNYNVNDGDDDDGGVDKEKVEDDDDLHDGFNDDDDEINLDDIDIPLGMYSKYQPSITFCLTIQRL